MLVDGRRATGGAVMSPSERRERGTHPGASAARTSIDDPGPPLGGNVTACATGLGRIHLLAVGTDGRMHVRSPTGTGGWADWVELDGGGRFERGATPGVVSRAPGRLEVFCRGRDGRVWLDVLPGAPSEGWSGWFPIEHAGPVAGDVSACTGSPDHLQLFAVGTDEAVHTQHWFDDRGWSGWSRLDDRAFLDTARPAAVCRHPGRFEVFCRGTDRRLWSAAAPDRFRPEGWSAWRRLADPGPSGGNVAVCPVGADQLQLFVVGTDGRLYAQRWLDADGWSGWHDLGGGARFDVGATPSAVCAVPGRVDVFCRDRDGHVGHLVAETAAPAQAA
jgi:hypothetical protein